MIFIKVFWNQIVCITSALFNLLGLVLLIDSSHIFTTIGDFQPIPYIFGAFILGFAVFPSLGIVLAYRSSGHALLSALFLSSIVSGLALLYFISNFFISPLETGMLVFFLSSSTTIISALIFSTFLPDLKNDILLFKIICTDVYTFIFMLALIIAYIMLLQSTLQMFIFIIECIAAIDLVILLIFVRTKYFSHVICSLDKSI